MRGTACFIGGILLVFLKWPFIGVIVETFGFLNLFGCVLCVILHTYCHLIGLPQRFLPRNLDFSATTAIYRQLIEFAIYSRRQLTLVFIISWLTSIWIIGGGSFSGLENLCSIIMHPRYSTQYYSTTGQTFRRACLRTVTTNWNLLTLSSQSSRLLHSVPLHSFSTRPGQSTKDLVENFGNIRIYNTSAPKGDD
jgi:hypothetical protein